MALTEKQMAHPNFMKMSRVAHDAVEGAANRAGFSLNNLEQFETQAGRVADDLTALLLRLDREITAKIPRSTKPAA